MKLIPEAAAAVRASKQIDALASIRGGDVTRKAQPFTQVWKDLDIEVETSPLVEPAASLFAAAAAAIRSVAKRGPVIEAEEEILLAGLGNAESASAIAVALEPFLLADPKLIAVLRNETLSPLFRTPIGESLRATTTSSESAVS